MSDTQKKQGKRIIAIIKLLLLMIIVAGIPAFLYFRFGSEIFSKNMADQIVAYLKAHQAVSSLIIIGIQIAQVVICVLPGQPIQFASSYMFGIVLGFILSVIGAVIGVTISFYIARFLGRDAMHLFFDEEKISDYQNKLNSSRGLLLVFLIYLIPGIPKDLVSYAAGISEMRFKPFLIVSTIGRIPGMLGSLLFGHFFNAGNYTAIVIQAVIVALILLICFIKRSELLGLLDKIEKSSEDNQPPGQSR